MKSKTETYMLWNNALGQWMPGYRTNDRVKALAWLKGCQPFMWVVRMMPTSFGEIIAKGGET